MKSLLPATVALLLACLATSPTRANPWFVYPPVAPDACGPGWYNTHPCGMTYGPNHWLTPGFPPFNGLVPKYGQPAAPGGLPPLPTLPGQHVPGVTNAPRGDIPGLPPSPLFPSHPYARSPRDYFMLD
jgi:hypothetical protein